MLTLGPSQLVEGVAFFLVVFVRLGTLPAAVADTVTHTVCETILSWFMTGIADPRILKYVKTFIYKSCYLTKASQMQLPWPGCMEDILAINN